jgi:heat shock protein HslJ
MKRMKTQKYILWFLVFLIGILMITGCGGGETPTAAPTEPTQIPETVPTGPQPERPEEVPVSEIQNIAWQWIATAEHNPEAQSIVPDPEKYTLALFDDGTYNVKADCKSGTGNYTVNGSQITLEPFPVTLQICSDTSLEPQYLNFLGQVETFGITDAQLILGLRDDAGEMHFQNSGLTEKPETEPVQMTLYFGPERVPCEGEGPQQCYQVREDPEGEWQLFYQEIDGFEWEPGYNYELQVNIYQVDNPPAGVSSLRYELIEVISKDPIEVENVTGIDPETVTVDTFNLPYSYLTNLVLAAPYNNTQPTTPTGLPQHIQINFGVSSPSEVQSGDPVFYIIPKDAYLELWETASDPGVKNTLSLLEILLDSEPDPFPTEGLPVLPNEYVTGYNDLAVQGRFFSFDRGYGVRFVGRFSEDAGPISNDGLFYIFQGFSQDGNYFYSFFYPVKSLELADTQAEIPAEEMDAFKQDAAAYKEANIQTLNGLAPADWEPSLETLDSLVSSLNYVSMYDEPTATVTPTPPKYDVNLVDISWQWTDFTDPNSQMVISDPENYVLVFQADGTLNIVADCNSGGGTYATNDSSITISVGSLTRADCGEESLSNSFLRYLPDVATYVFDEGRLVLNLKADAGNLVFQNAGTVVRPPDPEAGTPFATALEPINVRSGPGKYYESYGVVPIGSVAEIIGRSEDGKYWVVKLSTSIAPDGRGWVIATYVQAENAETVPIISAP